MILLQSIPCICKSLNFFQINLPANHEVISCCFECSDQLIIPVHYAMKFIYKVWRTIIFSKFILCFSLFLLNFLELYPFCISKIWINKSIILNNHLFYFQKSNQASFATVTTFFLLFSYQQFFFWITRLWYYLKYTQKNQEIFWKKSEQFIFFQVQSRKDYTIAIKKHFTHNDYFSLVSIFKNVFVKKHWLKNDKKRFPIN